MITDSYKVNYIQLSPFSEVDMCFCRLEKNDIDIGRGRYHFYQVDKKTYRPNLKGDNSFIIKF